MKNDKNTLITSSGVIKNRDKPRVGVIGINSELLDSDYTNDLIDGNAIDLSYEEFFNDLIDEGIDPDSEEFEEKTQDYECDDSTYLIGDWIRKTDDKGKSTFSINKDSGVFAATYSQGTICVEYSLYTRKCHHTSPCYVMSDGSGPCGDLDAPGDAVLAYDLPPDYYTKNG